MKYYLIQVCVFSISYPASKAHDCMTSLDLLYITTLFHKRHDFQKNFIENKMCADLKKMFEAFIILRIERGTI